MKRLLFAGTGALALLLAAAPADPSFAAMRGGVGGGGRVSAGSFGGGGGRVGGNFSAAPRAAVTGGNFSRGGTFTRGGTFAGRPGFAGRTATWGGRGGHWGWWHGRRHFFPGAVAAGVGVGLALGGWGWGDDCLAWDGWRYVNVCVGPTASGYGPGWGGPGWGSSPGWGGPGWW